MTPIVAPVTRESPRDIIANLHDALLAVLPVALPRLSETERRDLEQRLRRERAETVYSDATAKVVGLVQEQGHVAVTGDVDEPTATILNTVLRQLGLLDQQGAVSRSFIVSGQVLRDDGTAVVEMEIVAYHKAESVIRLGRDTTDAEGRYTISYQVPPELGSVALSISVLSDDGSALKSSDVMPNAPAVSVINLIVPLTVVPSARKRLEGRVILEHGAPAEQVTLRLYRREFGGSETRLAETVTREAGAYSLPYDMGGGSGGLEVRAVGADGTEMPLSRTLHRLAAADTALVNLAAPSKLQPLAPEFTRLSQELAPHVGEFAKLANARENDERQDLTLLNESTGWDARLIALASSAATLSTDESVGLPHDVLYGLFRVGLPSEKLQLARVSPDAVGLALQKANEAGIVNLSLAQIEAAQAQFATFARETSLAMRAPGSMSTYAQLLDTAGLDGETRNKFAQVFLSHRGDGAALWKKAAASGIGGAQIRSLQRQGKLAFLTRNSAPVTSRLQTVLADNGPEALVEQGFHEAGKWQAELRALANNDAQQLAALIPTAYEAQTAEERLTHYSEDMARKVRVSYPTQVVQHLVANDAADTFKLGAARQATSQLLKNAAGRGFRLGQMQIESFMAGNPEVVAGMSVGDIRGARDGAKKLQRVYQLTPSADTMPVLMRLGLDSAFDIVALSQQVFLERFGHQFSTPEHARLVYRKAQQVSSVTYNMFTIARKLDSEAAVHVMSSPVEVRDAARQELIKQFPTMESLFGSMDYCECEHCRSVLSPAAYLVDLLQFVDGEAPVWANFLDLWQDRHGGEQYTAKYRKPYDELVERRPDLIHIPLTCENTNTAMPYIDLVNEILEYYVANGKLDAAAAGDTGDALSEDLLAEPENITVRAYDELLKASYPLGLPFDLWLETVRQFCNHFETPLWKLLEVCRTDDALLAPTLPYDRASTFIESLEISPAERAILCNPDPLAKWFELYGFASAAAATAPAVDAQTGQRIDLNSAKTLARRLGVTYKELIAIVQTTFVNPQLAALGVLYKLKLSIEDLAFYASHRAFFDANKDLLGADRAALSAADQARYDALTKPQWDELEECASLEKRLDELTTRYASSGFDARSWLQAALASNAFDDILLIADPDAGGNFDLATLKYRLRDAGPEDFLRINLFVRLWRKLGWTIAETDRALQVFVPKNAPFVAANFNRQPLQSALIGAAHVRALGELLSVGARGRLKLLSLWSDIGTTGKGSLYAQLFLSTTVLKTDDVFDDPLGRFLDPAALAAQAERRRHEVMVGDVLPADAIDPGAFAGQPKVAVSYDPIEQVQRLSYEGVLSDADKAALAALSSAAVLPGLLDAAQAKAADFPRIVGHLVAIQGALGLTAEEIGEILADTGLEPATAAVSVANLSLLYRYRLLSKWLSMSVHELISFKKLSGVNPFPSLHPDPLAMLDQDLPFVRTQRFVEIAALVREGGMKLDELEYLLRHRFDETGKMRRDPLEIRTLLTTLAEGIRAIRAEHAVPTAEGEITVDVLQQKLGLALAPNVVSKFLAMVNGSVEFTVARGGVAPGNRFVPGDYVDPAIAQVAYDETRQEQSVTVRGVLFDDVSARLKAELPDPEGPAPHVDNALFGSLVDEAQAQARAFFDDNLRTQTLRLEDQTGFLEEADFALLFAPLKTMVQLLPTDTEAQAADKTRANEAAARESEATLHARRLRIAQAFLPVLQQQLVRQLIAQTLVARSAADPSLLAGLIDDERLLSIAPTAPASPPLTATLAATAGYGLTTAFFASADCGGPELPSGEFTDVDTSLRDRARAPLKPAGTNSARFSGYLQVPAPGAYRFFAVLDKAGASAVLRFEHLPAPVVLQGTAAADRAEISAFLELQAGVAYKFVLELRDLGGSDARLRVQGENLPKGSLTQLKLYSLAAIDDGAKALLLVDKAVQLIAALGLTEREVRYLQAHAVDFDDWSLSNLPTSLSEDDGAAQKLFTQFVRLAQYRRLRVEMAGDTDALIDVFEAPTVPLACAALARITRRDEHAVRSAVNALLDAPQLSSELPLMRIWELLKVVERFGIALPSLIACTRVLSPSSTAQRRAAIARDLRDAVKARHEAETWRRVAQPIFDELRKRKRDALAAHVMQLRGFSSIEQLYEYFLVDPGMEPVVRTSRIRLAIASVQLFVQRCMLNLEKFVHPSVINASHWSWMKRYRVWEANRKIFLFPENWLEPEFRDDKTHLFRELEGNLLQGDVSSDLVENAFLTYLQKLDQIAKLDIVATHMEDHADPALNTLHVIGRVSNQNMFFYRRFAHQVWSAWEPITAEIAGQHLAPIVWRDRLYLFWVTFVDSMEQKDAPAPPAPPKQLSASGKEIAELDVGVWEMLLEDPPLPEMTLSKLTRTVKSGVSSKQVNVQLHWSEYLHGAWSTHESSDFHDSIIVNVPFSFDSGTVPIHVSKSYEDGEERGVFVHLGGQIGMAFHLAGRNATPETSAYGSPPRNPYGASIVRATRNYGSGPLTVAFTQRITTEDGKVSADPPATPNILEQGGPYWLVQCDNDITLGNEEFASLVKPVFYCNRRHTLFIEPNLTERTIEEWQDWLVPMPQPSPEWERPSWWKDIFVSPAIPKVKGPMLVEPDNPLWKMGVGNGSLLQVKPQLDWVVNPSTALVFQGALIGPTGRADVSAMSQLATSSGLSAGGHALQVQAGSGLAANDGLVAAGTDSLLRAGLRQARGALNVVSGTGFNAALAQNFAQFSATRASHTLASRTVIGP